jgi:osomolarity two-component system sensor histidine kinase SLN1
MENSRNSVGSSQRPSRYNKRDVSNSSQISRHSSRGKVTTGTALVINPMDPKATPHILAKERSPTPPPANARNLLFEFVVEDTGPGIPENLQKSVFEPFVQGDLGLSKKFGGTGLGLSICSQLAGLMGGSIELVSTPGTGSTFTMRIPLKVCGPLLTLPVD